MRASPLSLYLSFFDVRMGWETFSSNSITKTLGSSSQCLESNKYIGLVGSSGSWEIWREVKLTPFAMVMTTCFMWCVDVQKDRLVW